MKKPKKYELKGGDGGAYGPVFGPVLAEEIREIEVDGGGYLMLKLEDPIAYKNDQIDFFVVAPRYVGDSLEKMRMEGCIVGVGRVLPGQEQSIREEGVTNDNVEYWSIGSCTPVEREHSE